MNFFLVVFTLASAQAQEIGYEVRNEQCREIRTTADLAPIQLSIGRQFGELAERLALTADTMEVRLFGIETRLTSEQKTGSWQKALDEKRLIIEALRRTSEILTSYAVTAEQLAAKNASSSDRKVSIYQLREFCDKDLALAKDTIEATIAYEDDMVTKFIEADELVSP